MANGHQIRALYDSGANGTFMTLRLIQELDIPLIKSPLPPVKYSNMVRGQVLGWANVGFHIDLVKQAQCVRVVELLPFSCVIGAGTTSNAPWSLT